MLPIGFNVVKLVERLDGKRVTLKEMTIMNDEDELCLFKKKKSVIIHVNRNILASNKKQGKNDPALILRIGSRTTNHYKIRVGNVLFIHDEVNPLPCGARAYAICEEGAKIEILE